MDFPFVGAGDARYFEIACLEVLFQRAPSADEAALIVADLPLPLAGGAVWDGPHLWVQSELGVGRLIDAAYGKVPKAPTALTTRNKAKIANETALRRFNAELERWLRDSHARVPICVAWRRPDAEAGGTALSDWHDLSLAALPGALASAAAAPGEGAAALRVALQAELAAVEAALAMAGQPDPEAALQQLRVCFVDPKGDPEAVGALAAAVEGLRVVDQPAVWWEAALHCADMVRCWPTRNLIRNKPGRAAAAAVFRATLTQHTAEDAVSAFQAASPRSPLHRYDCVLSVALEVNLRDGDQDGATQLLRLLRAEAESPLPRCADALERSLRKATEPELVARLRAGVDFARAAAQARA
ncbi:MAG: hypothetical protein JNM72_21315 [Deltaproteobacteria bacterium]|nr:hypothetical protein [Deltaproteobacteria bacterium]